MAAAALVALRHSRRVRRTIAELQPPSDGPLPGPPPHVSIVLPMRNEADHVDGIVDSLLGQDYPSFDLTVIDDGSDDATPALLAAWERRDARLRVARIGALPPGWAGKAHALHVGATHTRGSWLLFTDADTRHAPQTLRRMMGTALACGDDLLTLFPDTAFEGIGMRLLTPIGGMVLVDRATPSELRDPRHRRAYAIGQYLLVRRAAYDATGGYAAGELRGNFADDVALADRLKRHGYQMGIVSGRGLVKNRQWTTWRSAWRGWRKGAYGELSRRPGLGVVGGVLMLAYGLGPVATLCIEMRAPDRSRRRVILVAVTLALQLDARNSFDRGYGIDRWWTLTAPVGWAAFGALLLDTTWRVLTGRGTDWRGRVQPRP